MPNLTLIIGNKNYSSWSLRPWIFMRHHQVDFTEKLVPLFVESTNDELAPYLSDGKVPALVDGDMVLWDSLAILEYVSDVCLAGAGWPRDPHARALARSMSAEMHSSFMQVRNELPMNCRKRFQGMDLSAGVRREIERIRTLWRMCRTRFGHAGPWLFGHYSIADAMFAPVVLRFDGYDIAVDGVEAAYLQQVLGHPALVEWIEAGTAESAVIAADEIDVSRCAGWRPR